MIKCAGIIQESVVDGNGIRYVIFVQGCPHHCDECHNKGTWSYTGGNNIEIQKFINDIKENPLLSGVTFSGGEPFSQAKELAILAKMIHELKLNIWCYTGYTYGQLIDFHNNDIDNLLNNIDVLVDGRFEISLRDLTQRFKGSSNQRIIDMNLTRKNNKLTLLKF
jgi:anaerobic ribonucleoside-triphosphate reductase activating protein